MTKIGVISDTHDLMRPEALHALRGTQLIVHAGDICTPEILRQLRGIAPVTAVRGNNDTASWARTLPAATTIQIEQVSIHVVHDINEIEIDPGAQNIRVVISGHSHRPSIDKREGVLYLNPGSAGRRRFKLPIAVAILSVIGARARARIVELDTLAS